MSRILVLSELNPDKFGSREEFYINFAKELRQRGHHCFFGFYTEPIPKVNRMFEDAGGEIAESLYTFQNGKHLSVLTRIVKLLRFIAINKIDLVSISFYKITNPYLFGVYLSKAKIIYIDQASGEVPVRNPVKKFISPLIHSIIKKRVAKYVGITNFVRNRLATTHHVTPPQALTIYNAVNVDRFILGSKAEERRNLELPVEGTVIVAVASLIPEKGVNYLIEAIALLTYNPHYDGLNVLIVGEGDSRNRLESLAENLGISQKVNFLGKRNDVNRLIVAADMVVVPSVWHEGFGFIVAEAMAAGRPVIASKIGGIPELFEDEVSGLLVDPGDSKGIADAITRLLNDPSLSQRIAANAMIRCRKEFNLDDKVIEHADLFEQVLRS